MKNLKLAIGAVVAMSTAVANAGTYDTAASASVGVEAASGGTLTGLISKSGLALKASPGYRIADKLTLTLDNGATFQDAGYVLLQSAGGDATEFTTVAYSKGDGSITFRAASTILNASEWILSSSANAAASVTVGLPALTNGGSVKISGSVVDPSDGLVYATFKATEIFEYANEFAGAVDTTLNGTIDAVAGDRKKFSSSGTSDALALEFTETDKTYGVKLGDTDTVNISLKGDLSGVASITVTTGSTLRKTLTVGKGIASDYSSASVALSASDAFAATSTILNVIAGSGILSSGDFAVSAELDFVGSALTDSLVVETAKNAGTWVINGLSAKVPNMTLNNSPVTTSWLKVSNEGVSDAIIYADIIYSKYGTATAETKVTNAELGTVAPGTVFTVSEAVILSKMGNPTGLINATISLTVTGPEDLVHVTAEKKASDGRLNEPVYYPSTKTLQ